MVNNGPQSAKSSGSKNLLQGPHGPRSLRLRQRAFAFFMAQFNKRYEKLVAERKQALFAGLHGDVLEIGPGTGANLIYYRRDVRWLGIEPNPFMHTYLREQAQKLALPIEVRIGSAECLEAADKSMDAVVSTLVLCSVDDPARALREIRRVLKPNGRYLFIEHVAAPRGQWRRRLQDLIYPIWCVLADGCHVNRETGGLIEAAGFAAVAYTRFQLPLGPVAPHIAGHAIEKA
ncbi:MAG: class I SAM-dependent methyltransferase [Acidobacteria bacterium]|nr:class I SAM-dependent methyltransferase [Acidobacteriota bacterium]